MLQLSRRLTGRWSSLGIQLQNLKKTPPGGVMIEAIDAVKTGDLAHLRTLCPDNPLSLVGDIARGALTAAPGHRFIDADFSGIESRITAWLAGESTKISQWKKFDETGIAEDEPYYKVGVIFRLPQEQIRAKGKVGDLAFGFADGVGAYRALARDDPATDAEIDEYKKAWRRAHPKTCRFWQDIEAAAIEAMQHPDTVVVVNPRVSWCQSGDLRMRLPSGRELAYPFPRLFCDERGYLKLTHKDYYQGRWVDVTHFKKPGTWNGKLTENAVQAIARDIFAAAMPRLEAAGYPVVLHLHDEILSEVPEGFGSREEFIDIITTGPPWAEGLPIAAKGDVCARFCKIKVVAPAAFPTVSILETIQDVSSPIDAAGAAGATNQLARAEIAQPRELHEAIVGCPTNSDDTVDIHFDVDEDVKVSTNTSESFDNTWEYTPKYNRDGYPGSDKSETGNGEDRAGGTFGPSFIYLDKDGNFYSRATRPDCASPLAGRCSAIRRSTR